MQPYPQLESKFELDLPNSRLLPDSVIFVGSFFRLPTFLCIPTILFFYFPKLYIKFRQDWLKNTTFTVLGYQTNIHYIRIDKSNSVYWKDLARFARSVKYMLSNGEWNTSWGRRYVIEQKIRRHGNGHERSLLETHLTLFITLVPSP